MARVRSKNTTPELVVRRELHARGFRYRLHARKLPGRPDLVLPKWRIVVFVHGCFWHGCKKCDRGLRRPKTNVEFWDSKLVENRVRDRRNIARLRALGWTVRIIWECAARDEGRLREAIDKVVRACKSSSYA